MRPSSGAAVSKNPGSSVKPHAFVYLDVAAPEDGRTPPPANPAFTEGLRGGGSGSGGLLPDARGSLLTLIRDPFYTRAAKVFGTSRFEDGMTVLAGSGFPGNDGDSSAGDGFV